MSLIIIFLILLSKVHAFAQNETQFIYNGFGGSINKLHVDGLATILPDGLLQMTHHTPHSPSHAFYPHPVIFKPNRISFSTTFVFAMYPRVVNHSSHGISFIISPTIDFLHAQPTISSKDNTNQSLSHMFAIELDTIKNAKLNCINEKHLGIDDMNRLESKDAAPAPYYSEEGVWLDDSGSNPITVWVDYDEVDMIVNVHLAPLGHPKPKKLLLSKHFNLSTFLHDSMYVGFLSSTSEVAISHYILGWSWNQSGKAQDLDPSMLPSLPRIRRRELAFLYKDRKISLDRLILVLFLSVVLMLLLLIAGVVWFVWRKKYEELLEPWEKEYGSHRFSYKDLYVATKGFHNSEILGGGGFGKVYKGVLPSQTISQQVAVKRVSHNSKQGMKEFVSEISSMRRLAHKNLVPLLGYSRRKRELLLVYEYMPNGSLDKFLFVKDDKSILCWSLRFNIVKGVASALLYLHEEWEQVVLHRDVKASNVMLDAEMNARLGDFGLAKLYNHNTGPKTTRLVGTIGYIAPELSRTRKPTTSSDVFSFGMFLLEVSCGRKPTGKQDDEDEAKALFLSDWVYECWKRGEILKASDSRMEGNYQEREMELVLKLGLLCLQPKAEARPKMRQVVEFLNGSESFPDLPSDYNPEINDSFGVDLGTLHLTPSGTSCLGVMSSTNSVLQYGR